MDIDILIKEATLHKNSSAKEAFRAVKTELIKNQTSKNPKPEGKIVYTYNGADVIQDIFELDLEIIKKLIKQREESASIYESNFRNDLAEIEREQLKYLKELLPPEVSKDTLQEAIMTAYPNGYVQKEMGKIIKELKSMYPIADSKLISEVVKEHINL